MKYFKCVSILILIGFLVGFHIPQTIINEADNSKILSFIVSPNSKNIKFFWKDKNGQLYSNSQNLKSDLANQNQKLVFAVNGGMYQKDQSPQGLFIENGITIKKMNRVQNAYGNFYMQPNGIFAITKSGEAIVSQRLDFKTNENVNYATQSGPMLIINGVMHPKFNKGSANIHIRNGVGILPNGDILFAMSKEKINFYDFANYFKEMGCENALYLDGFVSRTYLPSKNWKQMDGRFGVIIGVTEN